MGAPAYLAPTPKAKRKAPPPRDGHQDGVLRPRVSEGTPSPPWAQRDERGRGAQEEGRGTQAADNTGEPLTYVVSTCDGKGAIFLAVPQSTSKIQGHLCEVKDNLRAMVRECWPQLKETPKVEDVNIESVVRDIRKTAPHSGRAAQWLCHRH